MTYTDQLLIIEITFLGWFGASGCFVSPPTPALNDRQRAYLLAIFDTDQALS